MEFRKKCSEFGCIRMAEAQGLCRVHYSQMRRFHGKDKSVLAKNREKKLIETQNICEICGKYADITHIHHKDGKRIDHTIGNLRLVCVACHRMLHSKRPLAVAI